MDDPTLTPNALRKRLEALESASGGAASHYVALLPVVSCESYQRATAITTQLKAAVAAAFPAGLHVYINPFQPNVWVDGDTATVEHDGRRFQMPLAALQSFWVEEGHKVCGNC